MFSGCALRVSARTLSAAKQGGAERPGDGCPCVGAEEICGAPPLISEGRNEDERRPLHNFSATPSANHNSKTANKYGNSGRASIDDTPGIPVHC